jgi:hypothetical protein
MRRMDIIYSHIIRSEVGTGGPSARTLYSSLTTEHHFCKHITTGTHSQFTNLKEQKKFMRKKSFQSLNHLQPNHLQPGVIIVSDSDSDHESKKRTKKPVSSTSNYQNDRIEIDLTADDSPPLVTTSRGTPLITTAKKSQKFAENHSFIDYYFPTNSTSPVLGTRHKRKIEGKSDSF